MKAAQSCNACPAVPELFSFEPVTLRTEHESAIITDDIVLCPKCAAEAREFPSIAAEIIRSKILRLDIRSHRTIEYDDLFI